MAEEILKAQLRKEFGSNKVRKKRREGFIPGVIYGKKLEEVAHLWLEERKFLQFYNQVGLHQLINLDIIDGDSSIRRLCILAEIQKDIFQQRIIHVDFHQVAREEKVRATVPLTFTGEPQGVKAGGILEHILREVEVEAPASQIPEHIEVDISSLDIGQLFYARQIPLPEGVRILTNPEEAVAMIHPPKLEVASSSG